jgi:hypothetical protein
MKHNFRKIRIISFMRKNEPFESINIDLEILSYCEQIVMRFWVYNIVNFILIASFYS